MKKQPTSKHGSSHRDQIKMLPTDWYIYSSYMYHILHPTPSGLRSFLAWFPLDQHRPTMARHTTSSSGSPLPLLAEELYLISGSGGAQHFNMTKSKGQETCVVVKIHHIHPEKNTEIAKFAQGSPPIPSTPPGAV